jgi:hypothetical protein
MTKGCNFSCMGMLLESVIVTEFQATEAYFSWDPAKAKYSISKLSEVEKRNGVVRISQSNFSAREKSIQKSRWKWSLQICTSEFLMQIIRHIKGFQVCTDNSERSFFRLKECTEHHLYTRSISNSRSIHSLRELIDRYTFRSSAKRRQLGWLITSHKSLLKIL